MKRLRKSSSDRYLVGICGGIAEATGISSLLIRLIFLFTASVSVWVYLFLAVALNE